MSLPTFAAFARALHGRDPFPWQRRLAEEVLASGWPDLLDLPTGSGKTSALDIALYCLAVAPDRLPRRTLLVVDRRIVVDQGAEHARGILDKLVAAKDLELKAVADALRSLWGGAPEEAPFEVAVMRGGMPRDNDWAKRPDRPLLGVSTVDQVGSRILFRGYGLSPRSASIHAGLLGNDTLILLDEVHLAVPFSETLDAISERFRRPVPGLPDRFGVVRMSATPGRVPPNARRFGLGAEDRADKVLKQRLGASKLAELVAVKVTGDDEATKRSTLARAAITQADGLLKGGAKVVGVVVNRVDTARLAAAQLEGREGTDVILVTGRMRPIDRDRLVRVALSPRAGAGRTRGTDDRPLVVVATQCIEAGADLDFDGLVTECASLDALRQRFGRLDRRGELGTTKAVILMRSDGIGRGEADPVYGGAMASTWDWLVARAEAGAVDFGIDAMPTVEDASLLAPVLRAPVMLPVHVDAWSQTSPPARDPDVALWLHGPRDNTAEVQIVWRSGLGITTESLEEDLAALAACRPSALESVSIPLAAARRWLGGATPSAMADVVAGAAEGSDEEGRGGLEEEESGRGGRPCLRWGEDDMSLVLVRPDDARKGKLLRPGDVLVVRAEVGGLRLGSFDPDSRAPVVDLGDLAQLRGRGVVSLRLDLNVVEDAAEAGGRVLGNHEAIAVWGLAGSVNAAIPLLEANEPTWELKELATEWVRALPAERAAPEGSESHQTGELATAGEWAIFLGALRSARSLRASLVGGRLHLSRVVPRGGLSRLPEITEAVTEDDDSSFRQVEVTLRAHGSDVRDQAAGFSARLGLSEALAADVALAAWMHDVGKADQRFQRWLVGGSEVQASLLQEPLAKSAFPSSSARERGLARARAGYPAGYRHELLSLQMLASSAEVMSQAHDPELVLHLVASHHGHCRPFAPPVDHPDDLPVAFEQGGIALKGTTRHRLSRLDSGVADRFWGLTTRYGWWGLAWLEALLRLADHRASEMAVEGTR